MTSHLREDQTVPYLDGRLEPAERADLEKHLAECAACRAQVEEMQALLGVLGEWKGVEVSPGFDAALRARLEQEKAHRSGWFVLRPAYAGAFVIALLVAVGVSLWPPSQPEPGLPRLEPTVTPQPPPVVQSPLRPDTAEDFAVIENPVLLENYELLEEFDILFEPLPVGKDKKL